MDLLGDSIYRLGTLDLHSELIIPDPEALDEMKNVRMILRELNEERLERFEPGADGKDLFAAYRVDEPTSASPRTICTRGRAERSG